MSDGEEPKAEEPKIKDEAKGEEDELDELKEMLKKKKEKKKSKSESSSKTETNNNVGVMSKDQYQQLLGRVYDLLRTNNPELIDPKKALLRPPTVSRVGTSRIVWTNFADICKTMRRDQMHVLSFFLTELGTTGSITQQQQFLMKGKFVPKYIESLLKKYINEYVTCHMCKGVDTKLVRDTNARMSFMTCEKCGATRAVATIQKGYVAATRQDRRAARNAS